MVILVLVILPACFKLLSRPLCTIKFASAQQRLLFQFLFILSVISFSRYSCFAVLCTKFLWNITTQQAICFKGFFKNDVTQNELLLIIHPLCHALCLMLYLMHLCHKAMTPSYLVDVNYDSSVRWFKQYSRLCLFCDMFQPILQSTTF